MIRKARLYARIKQGRHYPRVAVDHDRNGRAIQPKGTVTTYMVRRGGMFEDVGKDFALAVTRLHQIQAQLHGGVTQEEAQRIAPVVVEKPRARGRVRLKEAVDDYNQELKTLMKGKYSIAMYRNALEGFVQSFRKTYVDEIDRKDILNYIDWMKRNLKVRIRGGELRTYRNRLGYLGTFLNKHGIQLKKHGRFQKPGDAGLLSRDDMPKPLKRKPKKYDRDSIDLLLSKADEDQKDYLEFLLWSGFRDEEVQYLLYSDFDFKNSKVSVQAKPQYAWRPKDAEERTVQLPSEVSKRLKVRMERYERKSDQLVFPNGADKPDSHLIYRLHAVAKKAGLDLKGKRAGHMFRKTAGSRVANKFGLRAAMDFLGHSDIKTTSLYLAADDLDAKKSRQAYDDLYQAGD
jgi:integrase